MTLMKMNKRLISITFFAVATTMFMVACGGKDQGAKVSEPSSTPDVVEKLIADRSIVVTANDQMKFNISEIKVKPGEVLSITLMNSGTMPKFSMGHNFVVLQKGTDTQKFCEAGMTQAVSEYIPAEFKSSIIAATKLLGGGESDTIIFRMPSASGKYPFVCSFPGHYQIGMRGNIIVQ